MNGGTEGKKGKLRILHLHFTFHDYDLNNLNDKKMKLDLPRDYDNINPTRGSSTFFFSPFLSDTYVFFSLL